MAQRNYGPPKLKRGLIVTEDPPAAGSVEALLEKRSVTNRKAAESLPLPEFVEFMRQRLKEDKLSKDEEEKILPLAEQLSKMSGDGKLNFYEALKMAFPKAEPSPQPKIEWKYGKGQL